ncbi:MAG: hypothetical protein AAF823_02060 [Planctomycetota bacterium]
MRYPWLIGVGCVVVASLCFGPSLGRANPAGAGAVAERLAATEHRLANLERLMEIDLLDDAAVERRIGERVEAQVRSLVLTLRSQLELYQIQHRGAYPDLVGQGWTQMLEATDAAGQVQSGGYGPYLREVPVNPLNGETRVVGGTNQAGPLAGWIYNRRTGALMMLVSRDDAKRYGLDRSVVYAY